MAILDPAIDENIRQWHEACDARVPSVTAPPVPTITDPFNPQECFRLARSCKSANYETDRCSMSWLPLSSISYASCACQPPIYSLFSECMYNGNISCKHTTAHETNIIGYRECSYFWSGSVSRFRSGICV